ncbi:GH23000, related [Neospora caninum Liverpool]|uniref:GH23000, related n=1 Tax=Neospora caninum (strain Liverpool) TaxID=572307 RepID=F0VNJ1_NEOCL|nr:GH23000, related [Neospora caninum Liverpool]CBZ55287.1 GH23000, related [Neospora caninum Liverpool]CEL70018.1 TPA: GH23000, related [Neospora caninum Liverpool]|eukprot:XP_003885315.1 GH23000, related [Neospora caninum Liverpool]
MSSLEAVRADGYYYGPDYDPRKHGSLNQYRGSHPLGERAKRLEEGILVIRFEMPFKVWCTGCGCVIDKGVRFNAAKKCVGMHFSTKILAFAFGCPKCKQEIVITTDPKNAEYICSKGVRRKIETFDCKDAETLVLSGAEEREKMRLDPMFKLDEQVSRRTDQAEMERVIEELIDLSESRSADDYSANLALRERLRFRREKEEQLAGEVSTVGPVKAAAMQMKHGEEDLVLAKQICFRARKTPLDRLVKKTAMKMASIFDRKNVIPNKFTSSALQGKALGSGFKLGPSVTRIAANKPKETIDKQKGGGKRIPGTGLIVRNKNA